MKTIFLDETDVLFGTNRYLRNRLGVTADDIENGYIPDLFSCDPDKVKDNGYETFFVTLRTNKHIYVISPCGFDGNEEQIISDFFSRNMPNFDQETENTWKKWDEIKSGIAYRGGSGYCYGIYEYRQSTENQ